MDNSFEVRLADLLLDPADKPKEPLNTPKVDVTDAAEQYGLSRIPAIVWDFDEIAWWQSGGMQRTGAAAFSPGDWTLHLGSELLDSAWLTSDYNEGRFTRAKAEKLAADDALRFIIAHELYHALQDSHGPWVPDTMHAADHDKLKVEVEADRHAAQAYKFVKINGH